jgi:hypothetical protein
MSEIGLPTVKVSESEPEGIISSTMPTEPRRIAWDTAQEVPSGEALNAVFTESSVDTEDDSALFIPEPEEITLVVPDRRQIRVEWESPTVEYGSAFRSEVEFVPTILGGNGNRKKSDRRRDGSIFSAYDEPVPARPSVPVGSLMLGGLVVLISLFLRASGFVDVFFGAAEADEAVTAAAPAAEAPIRAPVTPRIDAESSFDQPVPESPLRGSSPKALPPDMASDMRRAKRLSAKERPSAEQDDLGQAIRKPSEATPIEPSTLVIKYGPGADRKAKSADSESSPKNSRAARDKTAGATRPRIVSVPRK